MYNPKPQEVALRVSEFLDKSKQDDNVLIDALISNIALVRTLLASKNADDRHWYFDLLNTAITHSILEEHHLVTKATDELIAEVGYTVKKAEDDYEFITHKTRY